MWPLAKVLHLWGLSPNLLHRPTVSKYTLARRQVYKSITRVLRTKIILFLFKNPFVTQSLPMDFFILSSSLTLGFLYPNSCHETIPSKPISCQFTYSCQLCFPGFTLSSHYIFHAIVHYVSCYHFQMSNGVYNGPISYISQFTSICHNYGIHSIFLIINLLLCFQYQFQCQQDITSNTHRPIQQSRLILHVRHI